MAAPHISPDAPRSSPRKPALGTSIANQDRDEVSALVVRNFLVPQSCADFCASYALNLQHHDPNLVARTQELIADLEDPDESTGPIQFLNDMFSLLAKEDKSLGHLKCYDTERTTPCGHPTQTRCRPDVCIVNQALVKNVTVKKPKPEKKGSEPKVKSIHWSALESVVEIGSTGKSFEERVEQTGAYLSYLLLARPDLLVGQALLFEAPVGQATFPNFTFFFGAGGSQRIAHTSLRSNHPDFPEVLLSFLRRLASRGGEGKNVIDHAIERICTPKTEDKPERWTFNLALSDSNEAGAPIGVCYGFTLTHSHSAFGRRTHVFASDPKEPDPRTIPFDGKRPNVVKIQYIREGSRFNEKDVLDDLTKDDGSIPGVVHALHFERASVQVVPGRRITRCALEDIGYPLLGACTLRQGLKVIYDLLEVTRFLYKERSVIHRDLNIGNVLICPSTILPRTEAERKRLQRLRFIGNILNDKTSQWATELLLIDFGNAEIRSAPASQAPSADYVASGVGNFMARAVTLGFPLGLAQRIVVYEGQPIADALYEARHPDRVGEFPSGNELVLPFDEIPVPEPLTTYTLAHEAESIFWVLFYWVSMIQPEQSEEAPIPTSHWDHLHTRNGCTHMNLAKMLQGPAWTSGAANTSDINIHGVFMPVAPLISKMAAQLLHDFHWVQQVAPQDQRTKPDFLHEAFQRLLVNFLKANETESFMDEPISEDLRQPQKTAAKTKAPLVPVLSLTQTASRQAGSIRSGMNLKRSVYPGDEDNSGASGSKKQRKSKFNND